MKTLTDIFDALPPSKEIASYIGGITDRAVRAWRLDDRNGIPGKHWPAIIRLARDVGADWITWEVLDAAHQREAA